MPKPRLLSVLLWSAIAGASPAANDPEVAAPRTAVEEARAVVERYCQSCHRSTLPTARPRALAVFDLAEPSWTDRMTDAQLRESIVRLAGERGPTKSHPARPDEVALVRAFVEQELARRAAGRKPSGDPRAD